MNTLYYYGVKGYTHIEKLRKLGHILILKQVKFTIGQAMKAQMGSRNTALLFL